VSLVNMLHLYRVRVRARLVQELFAIVGIAAGVALLFASQVASQSLHSSVAELSHGITGRASLQLLARDPHGMPQALLDRVKAIPGVRVAAPLLEASGQASGPKGSRSVELVGADASLKALGGALVQHTELQPFAGIGAVLLPAPLAEQVGVTHFGREVTLSFYGRSERAPLYEQLRERQIGGLVQSPIVVAPLAFAQELTGVGARVSRILLAPASGARVPVRAALERLAAGRLNVQDTGYDERLFAKAAAATNQSTQLFALISALVGFLFAFNAVLLTVPQRRRLIGELRREGYASPDVVVVLLLDSLVLGLLACVLGLGLGQELSLHLFGENPGYLGSAFAVGSQRSVGWQSVATALGGGMLAAVVAVLSPLRDILSGGQLAGGDTGRRAGGPSLDRRLALAGLCCLAGAIAILRWAPGLAMLGMLALIVALLATLPLALTLALGLLRALARLIAGAVGHVAAMELGAARSRAIGVAATGAVAVFGAVAIQGAHADLLAGLHSASRGENAFTDLWVSPPGAYNLLRTAPFDDAHREAIAALPGVRAVRPYRGSLLDWGARKVWVIAPSPYATQLLPASQILVGAPSKASARVRAGGWAVFSKALADERHLHIGQPVELPSPVPTTVRVAALSTNIGWAPGAVILSAAQYARAWGSDATSADNVLLAPGASTSQVQRGIQQILGRSSGLAIQSAAAHEAEQNELSRQGLQRLTQIATLILAVAVLAMAAAIASMLWQRRPRLAKLKLEGFSTGTLWRTILLESVLLAGIGSTAGGLLGLFGQRLLDQALSHVLNYPVEVSFAWLPALVSVAIVTGAAVAILAIAGLSAVHVPASTAMEE
jgi:putative ABC transport system permease protein